MMSDPNYFRNKLHENRKARRNKGVKYKSTRKPLTPHEKKAKRKQANKSKRGNRR